MFECMLTLQSSKSRIFCLLIVKGEHDSQGDDILFTSQGVSFSEVLEGLNEMCKPEDIIPGPFSIRRSNLVLANC